MPVIKSLGKSKQPSKAVALAISFRKLELPSRGVSTKSRTLHEACKNEYALQILADRIRSSKDFSGKDSKKILSYESAISKIIGIGALVNYKRWRKKIRIIYGINISQSDILNIVEPLSIMIAYNGPGYATTVGKKLYDYATRYTCGHISDPISFTKLSGKLHFPRILLNYSQRLRSEDPNVKTTTLAVIELYKLIGKYGLKVHNLDSLSPPHIHPEYRETMSKEPKPGDFFRSLAVKYPEKSDMLLKAADYYGVAIKNFYKRFSGASLATLKRGCSLEFRKYEISNLLRENNSLHITSSSTANGNSITAPLIDVYASERYIHSDGTSHLDVLKEACSLFHHDSALSIIEMAEYKLRHDLDGVPLIDYGTTDSLKVHYPEIDNALMGKIGLKPEIGKPKRPYACCLAISNHTWKGVCNHLFSSLAKIPGDSTFSHSNGFHKFLDKLMPGEHITSSLDMSNATNSFPVELILEFLEFWYPGSSYLFYKSVCCIPYYCEEIDKYIYFTVGQPLGHPASWSGFSMCHHILYRVFSMMEGINDFNDMCHEYSIVGDDFVSCLKDSVNSLYTKFITFLGINVSPTKGLSRESMNRKRSTLDLKLDDISFNFVARTSYRGVEITPIGPKIIMDSNYDPDKFVTLLWAIDDKRISLNATQVNDLCSWSKKSVKCALNAITLKSPLPFMDELFEDLDDNSPMSEISDLFNPSWAFSSLRNLGHSKFGIDRIAQHLMNEPIIRALQPFSKVTKGSFKELKRQLYITEIMNQLESVLVKNSSYLGFLWTLSYPDLPDKVREILDGINVKDDNYRMSIIDFLVYPLWKNNAVIQELFSILTNPIELVDEERAVNCLFSLYEILDLLKCRKDRSLSTSERRSTFTEKIQLVAFEKALIKDEYNLSLLDKVNNLHLEDSLKEEVYIFDSLQFFKDCISRGDIMVHPEMGILGLEDVIGKIPDHLEFDHLDKILSSDILSICFSDLEDKKNIKTFLQRQRAKGVEDLPTTLDQPNNLLTTTSLFERVSKSYTKIIENGMIKHKHYISNMSVSPTFKTVGCKSSYKFDLKDSYETLKAFD
jgi:hypothetical protein